VFNKIDNAALNKPPGTDIRRDRLDPRVQDGEADADGSCRIHLIIVFSFQFVRNDLVVTLRS
jgi:hypothetical protein